MDDGRCRMSPPKKAEKGEGVQRWDTPHTQKTNLYKSEFTSPTAQKILKVGGSNKGIWQSMQQNF